MVVMATMVMMVMTMKMTKLIIVLFNRVILRLGWRRPRVGTTMTMLAPAESKLLGETLMSMINDHS